MGTAVAQIKEVVEKEYEAMKRRCRQKISNPLDAEEVLHDSIAKALAFPGNHPDVTIDDVRGWMWRILHNSIVDKYRGRARSVDKEAVSTESYVVRHEYAIGQEHGGNTKKTYEELSLRHNVVDDLHAQEIEATYLHLINTHLTEGQRQPIIMYFFEMMGPMEIAEVLFPDEERVRAAARVKALINRGITTLKVFSDSQTVQKHLAA